MLWLFELFTCICFGRDIFHDLYYVKIQQQILFHLLLPFLSSFNNFYNFTTVSCTKKQHTAQVIQTDSFEIYRWFLPILWMTSPTSIPCPSNKAITYHTLWFPLRNRSLSTSSGPRHALLMSNRTWVSCGIRWGGVAEAGTQLYLRARRARLGHLAAALAHHCKGQ